MKKIVSLFLATSLILSNWLFWIASAAGVTATWSISGTTITINLPAGAQALWANGYVTVSVKDAAGTIIDISNASAWSVGSDSSPTLSAYWTTGLKLVTVWGTTLASSTITLTDADIVTNTSYSVSFNTSDSTGLWLDFWAIVPSNGTANTVTVSATVVPTLSMQLTNSSINFWQLIPDVAKQAWLGVSPDTPATIDILVKTNGSAGYALSASNLGLKDWVKEILPLGANADLTNGATYGYGTNASITGIGTISARYVGANNTNVSGVNGTTVASSVGPTAWDTVNMRVYSKISNVQAAWNYVDTVTYTLTGTF